MTTAAIIMTRPPTTLQFEERGGSTAIKTAAQTIPEENVRSRGYRGEGHTGRVVEVEENRQIG